MAGGERSVEALASVKLEGSDYLFLFVDGSLEPRQDDSQKLLMRAFGRALTDSSSLITPYEGWQAYNEVMNKDWSAEELTAIRTRGPFLLVINTSFSDFIPSRDPFAFVWLREVGADRGDLRATELEQVLRRIAEMARTRKQDLIDAVRELANTPESLADAGAAPAWAFFDAHSVSSADLTATRTDSNAAE
jgi:hypothetical protein